MSALVRFETSTPDETERLGEAVAAVVDLGTVVALRGELASGKTCFIRGMAKRFVQGDIVHSPTFTLVNEYGDGPKLYHLDLYRLSPDDIADLGYEDLFDPDNAVTAVEWAERAERVLPNRRIDVSFEHLGEDRRAITISGREGALPFDWMERLPVECPRALPASGSF